MIIKKKVRRMGGFIGHKFHKFILAKPNRLEFGECNHGYGHLGVLEEEEKSQANGKTANPRNSMKSCSCWLSDPGASENQFASLTLAPGTVLVLSAYLSPCTN